MTATVKCDRCGRRMRNDAGWNFSANQGRITGYLCPGCQSPEENAEAEINEATLDYKRARIDEQGRAWLPLKSDDEEVQP